MTITVIHGAPGTGKTRHEEHLREHYGCARILDEWDPKGVTRQSVRPRHGDLVLTQCSPETIRHHLGSAARIVSIEQALRAIGGAA